MGGTPRSFDGALEGSISAPIRECGIAGLRSVSFTTPKKADTGCSVPSTSHPCRVGRCRATEFKA